MDREKSHYSLYILPETACYVIHDPYLIKNSGGTHEQFDLERNPGTTG